MNAEQGDGRVLKPEIERRRALIVGQRSKQRVVGTGGDIEGQPGFVQAKRRVVQECGETEPQTGGDDEGYESGPGGPKSRLPNATK